MTPKGKLLLQEMRVLLGALVERIVTSEDDTLYRRLDAIRERYDALCLEDDLIDPDTQRINNAWLNN